MHRSARYSMRSPSRGATTNNIRLDAVSEGYPDGYIEEQLDEFNAEVEPYARALAEKLKF